MSGGVRGSITTAAVDPRLRLPVRLWPDEALERVCEEVPAGEDVVALAKLMIDTLVIHRGIGLAAPQVGERARLIVGNCQQQGWRFAIVNPRVTRWSGRTSTVYEEGCLSVPGVKARLQRDKQITVEGFGLDWRPVRFKARGLLAACLQHEIDHLDGVTLANPRARS